MALKLSSSQMLGCVVSIFMLLLLGILIYSIRLTNSKYNDYKLQAIINSPYESHAQITEKYPMGGGFEIEYQFRGKPYGEVMKVRKEIYRHYKAGDKIPITLSRNDPALVSLTSELNAYRQENHL